MAGIPYSGGAARYPRPVIVYLTGGIGTGKSTVLDLFAQFGATTVSADEIVGDLYARPEVQARIAAALELELPLQRSAIASRVFLDHDARKRLESVIHPLVAAELERFRQPDQAGPVIYEIPLLPTPQAGDVVIAVTAPLDLRLERLVARGMTRDDALRRMDVQPSPVEYGKHAGHTIVNDGDLPQLRAKVRGVWEDLQHGTSAI